MSEKELKFAEQKNSIDLLYDDEDIMIVSLDLMHQDDTRDDHNRNMCNISHKAIVKSIPTFYNKSITFRYNSLVKDFVSDITEHANDDNELFNTRIAGHIPSDSRITFIERDNGKTYCNAEAIIQKKYVPQLVEILKANNGELKVSVEVACSGTQDEKSGIFYVEKFKLQTVTLLSPKITEGIENSHLQVLKFSAKEIKAMEEKYIKFSLSQNRVIRNDIFSKIKQQENKERSSAMSEISVNDLQKSLWGELDKYKYADGDWEGIKYYIEEIYPDAKEIIVRDNEIDKYFKMPYKISEDGDVKVLTTEKKEVKHEWHERPMDGKRFTMVFAKAEYGKSSALKVDKSKDKMAENPWGEVDKTKLRNDILKAKNYKTLIYDVYADVQSGWEDSPSTKLKYPIMEIKDGSVVYSRYGLASALAYAKANKETEVVDKIEKLYKKLEIDKEDGMDGKDEVKNKIDKGNPEIEKIRDDADSIEDDKKEELKKNGKGELDKGEDEKLKDDVDSDKDYWEKKYKCLEEEFAVCKNELAEYKKKEDKELMKEYLKSYKKCFTAEEMDVMAKEIEECDREVFEKKVDEKVKAFVKKMSEDCEEDDDMDDDDCEKEFKNSLIGNPYAKAKVQVKSQSELDKALATLGIKNI